MSAFRDSLDAQHRQIAALLEQVVQAARGARWADYRRHFAVLRDGMAAHMAFEEEALFPVLEKTAPRPVGELRAEHGQIAAHIEMLGVASPEHDPEGCIAELEQLARVLRAHHQAEMALDPQYATRAIPRLVPHEPPLMDLRGLQPPEPIVRIFAALERAPREPLRVILPHEPVPIYALLHERGFTYSGVPRRDGGYELLIQAAG
jgi:hemerythrin